MKSCIIKCADSNDMMISHGWQVVSRMSEGNTYHITYVCNMTNFSVNNLFPFEMSLHTNDYVNTMTHGHTKVYMRQLMSNFSFSKHLWVYLRPSGQADFSTIFNRPIWIIQISRPQQKMSWLLGHKNVYCCHHNA